MEIFHRSLCFLPIMKRQKRQNQNGGRGRKRINYDNLFVFIEERDGITEKDLKALGKLHVRRVVAFTCNEYPNLPYSVFLPQYHSRGEVGNILKKSILDDSREYERYFDFVRWFNEAGGGDYDVSDYILR